MVDRPRAGDLLLAGPALVDPNFAGSVVLLVDSDADGALGVILNRPSPVAVEEVLPGWGAVASTPDVVFQGGPVSAEAALALALCPAGAALPPGWRTMYDDRPSGARVGLVDLDADAAGVGAAVTGLRVFAGYAGWGPDQIIDELEEGSWYVLPSMLGDCFGTGPEGLRERVLRRQTGMLSWVLTKPADPELN